MKPNVGWCVFLMLGMPGAASAFCGTYVGAPGDALTNQASQVALARMGDDTVLTFAVEHTGSLSTFGMVVPVPDSLDEFDVRLADADLFSALDAYSSPRLVAYTCDDIIERTAYTSPLGCVSYELAIRSAMSLDSGGGDTPAGPEADGSVVVEAVFTEGAYEFAILDATDGDALQAWLDEENFVLPPDEDGILDAYIEDGQDFLAVRVSLDALADSAAWLQPIQLRYSTPSPVLPIRIGTLSADGPQDVILYTLTGDSFWGIANYPEVKAESECMLPTGTSLEAHLEDTVEADLGALPAGWVAEYGWTSGKCDPCAAPAGLTAEVAEEMGYTGELAFAPFYFTRLRMHYQPEAATQDLQLMPTGQTSPNCQPRFTERNAELEWLYPTCGEGFPDDPQTCPPPKSGRRAWLPLGFFGGLIGLFMAARRQR